MTSYKSIVTELAHNITDKTKRHDRLAGTKGDKLATEYIESEFDQLGLDPKLREISFMGWEPMERPTLVINVDGEKRTVRAINMSWGGSTPEDGVQGTVKYVGKTRIINGLFYWDKYKIQKGGRDVGHIVGITEPHFAESRAQTLERADYTIPSVTIGHDSNVWLKESLESENVTADLTTNTNFSPQSSTFNIEAEIPGTDKPDKVIVISAHHDTLPYDPGASDNASGVACIIKLAEYFAEHRHKYTLRFVSFAAEEWTNLGARHYVRELRESGNLPSIHANLEIDTVGHPEGETFKISVNEWTPIQLKEKITNVLDETGYNEEFDIEYTPTTPGVNNWEFERNGIATTNMAWLPFPQMHQHHDSGYLIDDRVSETKMKKTAEIYREVINKFD